jgi:hypothetical protein
VENTPGGVALQFSPLVEVLLPMILAKYESLPGVQKRWRITFNLFIFRFISLHSFHFVKEDLRTNNNNGSGSTSTGAIIAFRRFSAGAVPAAHPSGGLYDSSLTGVYADFRSFNELKKLEPDLSQAQTIVRCVARSWRWIMFFVLSRYLVWITGKLPILM